MKELSRITRRSLDAAALPYAGLMPADRRRLASLIGILVGSGALHLIAPRPYQRIVPPGLGDARRIVYASGVVEIACAGLLAVPRTRRLGGRCAAALFVVVFPANLYAVGVMNSTAGKAAAIARLPLQLPMITAALRVAREA